MPRYYIRKQGRQHSVYTTPFTNYEEPPTGGEFALTVEANSTSELEAQIGTKDYVLIGPPARGSVEARACATDGHLPQVVSSTVPSTAFQQAVQDLGISDAVAAKIKEPESKSEGKTLSLGSVLGAVMQATAANRQDLTQVNDGNDIYDKALLEYKMLAIKAFATGTAKEKLTPVSKFLQKIWPDIGDKLFVIDAEAQEE